MPQQVTRPKPSPRKKDQQDAAASEHVTVAEIDELLDEIDAVFEDNVNEVLQSYLQRGGQ